MGMSYELFWEGPPSLAKAYRDAYRIRMEEQNAMAWIQGFYVYDAVASIIANVLRQRGGTRHSYIEKPVDLFPLSEEEKARREQEENEKIYKQFEELARAQRAKKRSGKQDKTGGE